MENAPRRRIHILIAAAAALALAAAACEEGGRRQEGRGDDQAGPPAELERFCTAMVDAEGTIVREGPQADVESLLTEIEETAPEEIQEEAATVVATVRAGAEDPSEFQRPEFGQAEEAIDHYVLENCGYETVEVRAVDFAFEGVPATIPAGRVGFRFTNDGHELHEMVVFRINEDVDRSFEEILQQPQQQAEDQIAFVGAGFGPPGETDAEVMELEPGRYGMACFVPMGTTDPEQGADGPPHFTEGMFAEFSVE
ncbi:MAG TPA: hypothetical protein VMM81_04940 [Acidimicrobiia bacterium]|nr:hypothetical protein [Acidimicrobiia bacterium]